MNNIFYEFLEKNNLEDIILDVPINENFNLPFVENSDLQPLRIDLVMYPLKVNKVLYNIYVSSVPKPLLYFTLKKSKNVLPIEQQKQILEALVDGALKRKIIEGKDYFTLKSPKTLSPVGKGTISGDAISWKKSVWSIIKKAIEIGSTRVINSTVEIVAAKPGAGSGSASGPGGGDGGSATTGGSATAASGGASGSAPGKSKKDMLELGKKLGQREAEKSALLTADNQQKLAKALQSSAIQDFLKKIEAVTKNQLPYDNSDRNLRDSVKKKMVIHPKITPETKKALDSIIGDYAKVQAALFKAGFNIKDKKIDFFMDLYKASEQGKAKADQIDWFYENYVNKHFTMRRIFNS